MIGELAPLTTIPPGEDVTVYEVTGKPPFDAGGANATRACALPASAATAKGAPGSVAGVTLLEGADSGPVPTAVVALTVKVYAVPLVSPPTTIGEAAPLAVMPPGEVVTMYDVIAEPPFD